MIKEDATDGSTDHKDAASRRKEEEEAAGGVRGGSMSGLDKARLNAPSLQRPQISITDAQGYVTSVPTLEEGDMVTDDPLLCTGLGPAGASGLSMSSMPGLASASKSVDLAGLSTFQTAHAGSANTIMGLGGAGAHAQTSFMPYDSSSLPQASLRQYHKLPFFIQYPGLNLANIPPDESMEVEGESVAGAALGYSTLAGTYPAPLLDYQPFHLGQYAFMEHAQMLQQAVPQYHYSPKDDPLSAYTIERGVSTRRGSQTLGSTGSTPEKDLHQEFTAQDLAHSKSTERDPSQQAHSAMLEALNLHNGLASVQRQNLCFALSLSLTSKRTMSEILKEIKRTLDDRGPGVVYQHSDNRFRLENDGGVQMEMEVCPGVAERGVRIRKLAGDSSQYKRLCNEIIAGMNL